jgi:hypothetical protein
MGYRETTELDGSGHDHDHEVQRVTDTNFGIVTKKSSLSTLGKSITMTSRQSKIVCSGQHQ